MSYLKDPIHKWCGKVIPVEEDLGRIIFSSQWTQRPEIIEMTLANRDYKDALLDALYAYPRSEEILGIGRQIRLENQTFVQTVEEQDMFFLSRLANIIFEDWFND